MTAQEYKEEGYKVSLQIEQASIDKAERTALECYVLPILPNATIADEDIKRAVMAISFLLLCYNNAFVTRAGVKGKNTPTSSESVSTEQVAQANALECARLIEVLRKKEGANATAKVFDVAKIYFQSNYFHL